MSIYRRLVRGRIHFNLSNKQAGLDLQRELEKAEAHRTKISKSTGESIVNDILRRHETGIPSTLEEAVSSGGLGEVFRQRAQSPEVEHYRRMVDGLQNRIEKIEALRLKTKEVPKEVIEKAKKATLVDCTGCWPREEMPEVENPVPLPWRSTWLEDLDQEMAFLVLSTKPHGNHWTVTIHSFYKGSYVGVCQAGLCPNRGIIHRDYDKTDEGIDGDLAESFVAIAAFMAKMFSCKNVEVVDNPTSRKIKKKQKADRRQIIWKIVEIVKNSKRYRLGKTTLGGKDLRHHIVGGHFKTFTPEAPLMGRHVGTFWWGDFARGRKKKGKVVKIYSNQKQTPLERDARGS